ncbi:MAG TPA: ABC transporter substrate-binding protein [Coleofasciculaceae cyanobacterium]|jgi:peptide/nickel transport system substrate-binding protein
MPLAPLHRRWFIALLFTIFLALNGCSAIALKTQAARGSQLILSTLQDPKTFNYALNQEFPSIFLFCFRGLLRQEGMTGELQPDLAESWEISADKLRVTFTLRQNLKWSDGHPLTADDVVFTYRDVIFNEKIPAEAKDTLRIGINRQLPEVRKLDDRRIEFVLPEPFAPFLRATAGPPTDIVILPKHKLEASMRSLDAKGNPLFVSTWGTDTDPKDIVVNGPYLIEQYRPAERLIFRRNPYYWQQDAQGKQLPYIDRIIWQLTESTDAQLLAFRSGDLDVIGDVRPLRPEYYSLLKREEKRGRFKLYNGGAWSGTTFIQFNLNQAKTEAGKPIVDPIKSRWFNSLAFRQAIAHAIDRPRMINNIYRGISTPQDSPISVQSPYYLPSEKGLKTYDYSLEKAKQLLLSAGFTYGAQGQLLDAEGNRVQFTLQTNSGNRIREALGSQIRTDLAKIGIQVDFTPIAFNTLISKLNDSRDWDCILIGFTGGVDPYSGSNLWLSTGSSHMFNLAPQPGQAPIQGWNAADWELRIDQLFKVAAQELDETKRQQIYGEFQQITQEYLPVINLVNEIALMAVRDRLQGLKYNGLPSWGLWNIQELQVRDQPSPSLSSLLPSN